MHHALRQLYYFLFCKQFVGNLGKKIIMETQKPILFYLHILNLKTSSHNYKLFTSLHGTKIDRYSNFGA